MGGAFLLLLPESRAFTKPRDSFGQTPESISEFHCRMHPPLVTTVSAIHSLGGTGCFIDLTDGHQDDQETNVGKRLRLIC